jgi:hypothetical protein
MSGQQFLSGDKGLCILLNGIIDSRFVKTFVKKVVFRHYLFYSSLNESIKLCKAGNEISNSSGFPP